MEVDLNDSVLLFDPGKVMTQIEAFTDLSEKQLALEYLFDADLRICALNEVRKLAGMDIFERIWSHAPPGMRQMSPCIFYGITKGQIASFPSELRAGIELVRQCWQFRVLGESTERFTTPNWIPHEYDSIASVGVDFAPLNSCADFPQFWDSVSAVIEDGKAFLDKKGLSWANENVELRCKTDEWRDRQLGVSGPFATSSPSQLGLVARDIVYSFSEVMGKGLHIFDEDLLQHGKQLIDAAFQEYASELKRRSKNSVSAKEELNCVLSGWMFLEDFQRIDPQDKSVVRRLNQSPALAAMKKERKLEESFFENEEWQEVMALRQKYILRASRYKKLNEMAIARIKLPKPIYGRPVA